MADQPATNSTDSRHLRADPVDARTNKAATAMQSMQPIKCAGAPLSSPWNE